MFRWIAARPALELILVSLGLIADGFLGAWVSTRIRAQSLVVWFALLSGNISLLVWMYLARYSHLSLPVASMIFDLLYNIAWMVGLVYLGAKVSTPQMVGIALIVVGVSLLAAPVP